MERELILRAKRGDGEAFSRLVSSNLKRLYRACYFMLRDVEETADLCQEVFLRAYRAIANFDADRPFYPWIYTIMRNLYINKLNRRAPLTGQYDADQIPDSSDDPEERFLKKETVQNLMQALDALAQSDREILILRHWSDCSYQELSEILSIPKGTVMSRLYYARVRLRERMAEIEGEAYDDLQ